MIEYMSLSFQFTVVFFKYTSNKYVSWTDANAMCRARGMNLLTLNTHNKFFSLLSTYERNTKDISLQIHTMLHYRPFFFIGLDFSEVCIMLAYTFY